MEWVTRLHLPKPKMVATDVDGTLIDEDEQVSPRTRAAVAALVADGVQFVLATGRPPRWIDPVVEGLGYAPLCVCGNGAVIYDSASDRILHNSSLDVAEPGRAGRARRAGAARLRAGRRAGGRERARRRDPAIREFARV